MEYGPGTTPQALVANVMQLLSLPAIYLRLQSTIDDPRHTRDQIAEIIAYDPSLSARVLRIANSSYYSFARELNTVAAAVAVIGEVELSNLVLAASLTRSMNTINCEGVDIDEFWLNSLHTGINARLIAQVVGRHNPEVMFLAGILHDLGILVMYQQEAILSRAVKRQMQTKRQLRDQAERELLGFDHAEVGAILIETWGLPAELVELVRYHHQYQLARQYAQPARMLALANLLVEEAPLDIGNPDNRLQQLAEQLEISRGSLVEIAKIGQQQCEEVKCTILG